jgi:hypothetical protein
MDVEIYEFGFDMMISVIAVKLRYQAEEYQRIAIGPTP